MNPNNKIVLMAWIILSLGMLVSYMGGYYDGYKKGSDFTLWLHQNLELNYDNSNWSLISEWDCYDGVCSNGNPRGSEENGVIAIIPSELRCNVTAMNYHPYIVRDIKEHFRGEIK